MEKNNLKIKCPKCFKILTENTFKYYHNKCEGKPTIRRRKTIINPLNSEEDKKTEIMELCNTESVKKGLVCFFSSRCC